MLGCTLAGSVLTARTPSGGWEVREAITISDNANEVEWLEQAEWDGNRFQVDMRNYDQETPLGPSAYVPPENPQPVRNRVTASAPSGVNDTAYTYSYAPALQVAASQPYICSSVGYSMATGPQYTYAAQVHNLFSLLNIF
jgi:hypothetical protein